MTDFVQALWAGHGAIVADTPPEVHPAPAIEAGPSGAPAIELEAEAG
jgi:hypothetical protein